MTVPAEVRRVVDTLFRDPKMLDSRSRWRRGGFDVVDRDDDDKIMVAGHASAPRYMFKKFANDVSSSKQLKNYRLRVEGIEALRRFVGKHGLERIVLPEKWVVDLPEGGALLVVEKIDLVPDREMERAYGRIDDRTLRDLCVVLHKYRGLDSGARNVPLTRDGRVAFIDTERWDQDRDRPYMKRLRKHLSSGSWKIAEKLFRELSG